MISRSRSATSFFIFYGFFREHFREHLCRRSAWRCLLLRATWIIRLRFSLPAGASASARVSIRISPSNPSDIFLRRPGRHTLPSKARSENARLRARDGLKQSGGQIIRQGIHRKRFRRLGLTKTAQIRPSRDAAPTSSFHLFVPNPRIERKAMTSMQSRPSLCHGPDN